MNADYPYQTNPEEPTLDRERQGARIEPARRAAKGLRNDTPRDLIPYSARIEASEAYFWLGTPDPKGKQ
jgi:hypothetical protein